MIKQATKIELHYFFRDDTHTMNATVRNECEKELLKIFKEVTLLLDLEVDIESEAFKEGGLKEKWKLVGKYNAQILLVLTVLQIVLSRFPVENKELVKLQIENLELDNEIKRHELIKIKKETESEKILPDDLIEYILKILDNDYKIILYKSNFYKKLAYYPKVTKISSQLLNGNNEPIEKARSVERNQFANFILRSDTLSPNIDDEAIIDIISPVLKKGNFNWKGFYKGEILNFKMDDFGFKKLVIDKEIEFINGIAIRCILRQDRKIDEAGFIKIIQNRVLTVLEVINNDNNIVIEQIKKNRSFSQEIYQLKINF